MRFFIALLVIQAVNAGALSAPTQFELRGDLLSVQAVDVPVQDILGRFAQRGITARIDPSINPRVTTRFKGKPLTDALDLLFKHVNYIALWDIVEGPLGPITRLAEIQVFEPGRRGAMQPLQAGQEAAESEAGKRLRVVYAKGEVLLRLRKGTTAREANAFLRDIGGNVVDSIPALGIYRVRLPPGTDLQDLLKHLARDSRVAGAEPNLVYEVPRAGPDDTPDSPSQADERGLPGEDSARVAILDSGLVSTASVSRAVVAQYDALTKSTILSDPVGHGTQMAYLASGMLTPIGATATGSESVPVIAIRAFDDEGRATNFDLIRSVGFALESGARVMNLSWSSYGDSAFLKEAIDLAIKGDVIVVAAAGNEPTGVPVYPAALDGVLAVAAAEPDGSPWPSSNSGSFVDFTAPGYARVPADSSGSGMYAGTSIASAYAAGILARYLSAHPDAGPSQTIDAFTRSLTVDASRLSKDYGAGLLDDAAIKRLFGEE